MHQYIQANSKSQWTKHRGSSTDAFGVVFQLELKFYLRVYSIKLSIKG